MCLLIINALRIPKNIITTIVQTFRKGCPSKHQPINFNITFRLWLGYYILILHIKKIVNQILAKHTGQTIKKIEKDTDRDNFLDAPAAIKYGIVDGVLNQRDKADAK